MADPDIFWHLRNAAYLIHTHHWIRQDMYAATTLGMPWVDHEWLSELPFYGAYHLLGMKGLCLLTIVLVETIFLGSLTLTFRVTKNLGKAWAVTVAGVTLGTVSFGPRTLLFGWVCLIGELLLLERFERRRDQSTPHKELWPLVPLFLVWINLHGSWFMGLALFALYIVCGWFTVRAGSITRRAWTPRERRGLCVFFAACAAAVFANPYGWKLVVYPLDFAFRQTLNVACIDEWQALNMQSIRARVLLVLLATSFIMQLVRRRAWQPYRLAFVLFGAFAAFTHARFSFLAALITLPYLAPDLPWPAARQPVPNRPLVHAALLLCMLCAGACLTFTRSSSISDLKNYPVQALPYLRAFHPQGKVLTDFLWGGYLELNAPEFPVFIDSRVDIFERRGVLRDYLAVVQLQDSSTILDRNAIRYVLFEKAAPLTYFLRQSGQWHVLYQDSVTVLFERNAAEAEVARR